MADCVVGVAASTAVSLLFFDHHPRLSICHAGLGLGDNEDSLFPSIIEFNTKHKISDVQTGDFHTAAVTELGVVFVWGAGFNGSKFYATACMRLADQCIACRAGSRWYISRKNSKKLARLANVVNVVSTKVMTTLLKHFG